MKKLVLLLGIFLIGVLLFACAPKATPAPQAAVPAPKVEAVAPAPVVAVPAKAGWEAEWERVKNEAKKEGKVVIYGSASVTQYAPIRNAFRDKFGLSLETVSARGATIAQKLLAERRGGLFLVDIYAGGPTTPFTTLKPEGILVPLEPALLLPEVIDPQAWYGGGLNWVDSKHTMLAFAAYPDAPVFINTDMVGKDEIKSFNDLLNPKWKGKIVWNDPTMAGPGASFFVALVELLMGYDYAKALAKQEPVITRDERLLVEWVAKGKYAIGIGPDTETVVEFQKAGAPIAPLIPVEGTYLLAGSGVLSLIKDAPHPNAAKVFVNWLLTKEGGIISQGPLIGQSARVDVPTAGIGNPLYMRQPNTKYYRKDTEELLLKNAEILLKAKEILGIK